MNFTRYNINPMTKAEAMETGNYYKVPDHSHLPTLVQDFGFVLPRIAEYLYVETPIGQEVILSLERNPNDVYKHMESCGVYDPKTGIPMHSDIQLDDIILSLIRPYKQVPSRSGKTVSVFLDKVNMDYYKNQASEYLNTYGPNPIDNQTVTGQEFYNKIMQMCQIAEDVITGKLLPDLFDLIRIKKDGTFQLNRKFLICDNNLYCTEPRVRNYHGGNNKLTLCIITQNTFEFYDHYDVLEHVDLQTARLAITVTSTSSKQTPLIVL